MHTKNEMSKVLNIFIILYIVLLNKDNNQFYSYIFNKSKNIIIRFIWLFGILISSFNYIDTSILLTIAYILTIYYSTYVDLLNLLNKK
jgi:hypothetical protein